MEAFSGGSMVRRVLSARRRRHDRVEGVQRLSHYRFVVMHICIVDIPIYKAVTISRDKGCGRRLHDGVRPAFHGRPIKQLGGSATVVSSQTAHLLGARIAGLTRHVPRSTRLP